MKNKKYLGMLGLGCAALLLTGCGGGNKLTCTKSEEKEGEGKTTTEVIFTYDKDWKKIENVDMEMSIELEDDKELDTIKAFLDAACEDEDAPKNCKVKSSGKKVALTASGSPKDIDMDYDVETSKEDIKADLEEDGYTCK